MGVIWKIQHQFREPFRFVLYPVFQRPGKFAGSPDKITLLCEFMRIGIVMLDS